VWRYLSTFIIWRKREEGVVRDTEFKGEVSKKVKAILSLCKIN
jgi:hypothetical protein